VGLDWESGTMHGDFIGNGIRKSMHFTYFRNVSLCITYM